MGWLRDTPYHAHLVELIREMRTSVAIEDHDELERFVRSFHFKRREAARDRKHSDTTNQLVTAIRERRVCRATYQKLSGEVGEYVFEPWSLMLIGDASFVLARERSRASARTFELSSIASLAMLDEIFMPPSRAESDAATLLGNSIGSYAANYDDQQDVTLRVKGQAEVLLRRRPLHSSQTVEPRPDGWATIRLRVVVCPEMVSAVLSLLPDVRVVGPASLREEVGNAAGVVTGSDWDPRDP
jgi:predicted DNA-binding transcriptional regulator YafY